MLCTGEQRDANDQAPGLRHSPCNRTSSVAPRRLRSAYVFDRNGSVKAGAAVAISTALVAGCSSLPGGSGDVDRSVEVGTTSAPTVLDPAAAWDTSWELYKNVYQTLMTLTQDSSSPQPEAAKKCGFTDSESSVYRCTLRSGLKFSNGHPLTAKAVKYSFERIFTVNDKRGPASLLQSLDRVETPNKKTVVFHLKKPDATFPFKLATPAGSIVDPAGYPKKKLRKGNSIVGSGPYTLKSYAKGKKAELVKNPTYKGSANVKNDKVTIDYYKRSADMVRALRGKKIDLALRQLDPHQISSLRNADAKGDQQITLSELPGTDTRFLVFNPKDPVAGKPAVRKAVAQVVDRKALARKAYDWTVDPLYSMVPAGITSHTNTYLDTYGEPDRDKAAQELAKAGIHKKVPLTLWYATDRYGSATKLEFQELKRQLEGSGLFSVKIKGRPWSSFVKGVGKGKYPAFGRGWFPDFPDPDNYVASFVGKNNAIGTPYKAPEITDKLLPRQRKENDRAKAGRYLAAAQRKFADDAQLLPLFQAKLYVAAQRNVSGLEWVFDPRALPQLWELHKKSSW
jgi:peptide/nickel transport system substrate-binding protein